MSGFRVFLDPHARCAHRRYRLTCEEYDALEAAADGKCQVCETPVERGQIDHDHNVGQWAVRGLVCRRCNGVMRMVDEGRWGATERVARYIENAWHVGRTEPDWTVQPKRRRELNPAASAARQMWDTERGSIQ